MNHVEVIEGFDVAIAALLGTISLCNFYAGIYFGVRLPAQSTANSLELESMRDSALPELYAAVIVFTIKARAYFEARGMYAIISVSMLHPRLVSYKMLLANSQLGIKKIANTLKPFDLEFQPYIEEINAKEGDIRKYADAASMERIKGMIIHLVLDPRQDLTPE